jgi:two-component system CheB/CheR fusion protein
MRQQDFDMDYQPIVDLRSGTVLGVEALVRWVREDRRVAAGEFIPTMEATGQLRQLGRMIRELIAEDLPHLMAALPPGGFVTLNMAIVELEDLVSVERMLDGPLRAFAPSVAIEITETADFTAGGPADRNLERLRSAGYLLAIDDFGTGYSNFSLLERLQPEILKLDRSLLSRSGTNVEAAADFLDAATRIGHAVGSRVLAEGVEGASDVTRIVALGIDLAQGYHFARPAPLPQVLRQIEARKATGAG